MTSSSRRTRPISSSSPGASTTRRTPLDATFRHDLNFGQTKDPATKAYRKALLDALPMAMAGGVEARDIAGRASSRRRASTRSPRRSAPSCRAGRRTSRSARTASGRCSRSPRSRRSLLRQTGTARRSRRRAFFLPLLRGRRHDRVRLVRLAGLRDGRRGDPRGRDADRRARRAVGEQVQFTLWVPAGAAPAGGWPVAIFGHGFTDRRTARRPPSRRRSRATASRRSRSTSSATAAAPLGTYTVTATGGAAGDAADRRPRHRPGRQRHDRLDRGRQRGRRAVADRQPRRPAPDGRST